MMEGDSNVTDNRKGKQKTSIVWAHFTRSKEDTVSCVHCQKTLLLCQGSTSSLLKHLRAKHPTQMTNISSNGQQSEELLIDIAEERKLSRRKEKQSIVWSHFTRAEEDDDVTCLHCKKRLKYSRGSTTSMRNHLRARHPAEMYRSERHREIAAIAKKNGIRNGKPWKQNMPNAPQPQQPPAEVELTTGSRSLESRGDDMATDQSLDDRSESKQRVETLLKCLEGKERELAEAYETFQNTVRALREDMETIKEQLTNLTGEHHKGRRGNTGSNKSPHTGPNSFQDEVCEDRPLLSLSCTSEPNSPGYDDAERSQRSSGDQEVTIIGLFTPHSTVYASYDRIVDYTNTYTQAAYTSETSPRDTQKQPAHIILQTPSVRLLDCRHKLGPDGVFLVHSDQTQEKEEDDDNDDDEDEYVDGGSNDNEVFDCNLETDPDYNPEENYESDSSSEKLIQTSGQKKASSLCAKQQHPPSPLQEALLKEPGVNPMEEERPFKCPKCGHSYKYCSDFIQHLKMHGLGLQPLRPKSRQKIEDDRDGDDKTELDPEYIPENVNNIEDNPEKQALQSSFKKISSSDNTKDEVKDTTAKQWVSEPVKPARKVVKRHQCEICGRRLSTSGALYVHQRQHREENIPSTQDERGRKLYKCGECDRSFVGLYFFYIHQGTHRGERPYVCPWCRKTFVYPAGLHRHKKWHCKERSSSQTSTLSAKGHVFACAQCPRTFYQRASLKYHERKHSEERPYKCPLCIKIFKYPGSLREHLKGHDGQKPYLCDHCGKSFRQFAQLKRHLLFHSEEKLYKCSVCDKRYHIQQSLTQHILTHSKERPFRCRICDKGFTRLQLVQKHERVHTKEKPYSCSFCGKFFGYQESLYVHQKRYHSSLGQH